MGYETQEGTARLYKAAKIAYAPVDLRQPYQEWVRMPMNNVSRGYSKSNLEYDIEKALPQIGSNAIKILQSNTKSYPVERRDLSEISYIK